VCPGAAAHGRADAADLSVVGVEGQHRRSEPDRGGGNPDVVRRQRAACRAQFRDDLTVDAGDAFVDGQDLYDGLT